MSKYKIVKHYYSSLNELTSKPFTISYENHPNHDISSALLIVSTSLSINNKDDCIHTFYPIYTHYEMLSGVIIHILNESKPLDILYTMFFQKNPLSLIIEGAAKAQEEIKQSDVQRPYEESKSFCFEFMEWIANNDDIVIKYKEIFENISDCYSRKYLLMFEIIISLCVVKIGFNIYLRKINPHNKNK